MNEKVNVGSCSSKVLFAAPASAPKGVLKMSLTNQNFLSASVVRAAEFLSFSSLYTFVFCFSLVPWGSFLLLACAANHCATALTDWTENKGKQKQPLCVFCLRMSAATRWRKNDVAVWRGGRGGTWRCNECVIGTNCVVAVAHAVSGVIAAGFVLQK